MNTFRLFSCPEPACVILEGVIIFVVVSVPTPTTVVPTPTLSIVTVIPVPTIISPDNELTLPPWSDILLLLSVVFSSISCFDLKKPVYPV